MHLIHHLMRIEMILEHVLYLSYALPAATLRPFVPDALHLATEGDDQAFLSVVLLKCHHVHASSFPLLRFAYRQINIRTYVKDPATGEQAVYFLRSAVTSPLISALTRMIGLPWERAALDLKVSSRSGGSDLRYDMTGSWQGDIVVQAGDLGPLPIGMPPFENSREAIEFLILPLTGFFGRKGRVKGVHIEHPALHPQILKLRELKLPLLTEMALLKEDELNRPHCLFYVPEAFFRIYLPAMAVR